MPPYKDKTGRWRFRFEYGSRAYSGSSPKTKNTRSAAIALERALLEKVERNIYVGVMPTVEAFVDRFLEYQSTHTSQLTREGQEIHLVQHVVPVIGRLRLDVVGTLHIDQLKIDWTAKGAAPTTINTRLGTLRRMLSLANEWRFLFEVPKFKWMPTDTGDADVLRFLTDAESAALVAAAAPAWRSMILVGLRTGLRIGELRGLQWVDVDLVHRSIRVVRTDPGRPNVAANTPKGGRARTVPITEDAYQALTALEKNSKWVWPALEHHGKRKLDRTRSASGCWHGVTWAAEKAGIVGVGPHVLRHTYASQLVMRGVSLKVVQELLGHASIKQTEVYAHLAPGFAHHAAVAALDLPLVPASSPLELGPGEPDKSSSG